MLHVRCGRKLRVKDGSWLFHLNKFKLKGPFTEMGQPARGVAVRLGSPLVMLNVKHPGRDKQVIVCRSLDLTVEVRITSL